MNEFFRSMMGRVFFEGTLPKLVREIARLNDNLERMNAQQAVMFASAKERDAIEDARQAKYEQDCATPP